MRPSWSEIARRVGGPRAITLVAFLVGSPFWMIGFIFNEPATYQSTTHALVVVAISVVSQGVMGLVLWCGFLATRKQATKGTIPLWALIGIWSGSAVARTLVVAGGLDFFDTVNPVPLADRLMITTAMAVVGYGLAAYGLDAFDRFREERAQILRKLLDEEEQLTSHRDTIEGMKVALVAQVEEKVQQSQLQAQNALDRLEGSLVAAEESQPALDELRALSDETWQKISQDLWAQPPATAPKIRVLELMSLWARSNPLSIPNYAILSVFLYLLIYSRVFEPLTGVMMTSVWFGLTVLFSLGANLVLAKTTRLSVPLLSVALTVVIFSSVPVLLMFESLGFGLESWRRVVIVHAISVLMVTAASLPPAVVKAREKVLGNLRHHLDSKALEKLQVESQLAIVAQKIANHLHGDVRGNFLAAMLNLQGHLDAGDITKAREDIGRIRRLLTQPMSMQGLANQDGQELEEFLENWATLIDIQMDKPVSAFPEEFVPALHTIVVDAVNNAVRHGGADWIRITSTLEPDSVVLAIHNNGSPNTMGREGLGTANLNLLAPDQWSRIPASGGVTQLLVKLDKSHVTRVLSRR
jgi:signal transduction histidine kinase